MVLSSAAVRAKAKGLPYGLNRATLPPVPTACPILGITLVRGVGVGNKTDASPTLDRRIRPDLGYVPGNIRWISHRANRLRSDMTLAEAHAILADLIAIEGRGD